MECKSKSIFIEKKDENTYRYESESHSETDLTECQLMSLLGAVLGVSITNPRSKSCSWCIKILKYDTKTFCSKTK